MTQEHRRNVEGELAAWRDADRREDEAESGSPEEEDAQADAAHHRAAYTRLTDEVREEPGEGATPTTGLPATS
jgi:hypothetical protein